MVDEVIERVTAAHTRQGGCPVACIVDKGLAASPALSDTLESIVGEGLANIRKHARAQHAIVSCTSVDGTLYLGTQDDGIGLPPESTSSRAGARLHFGIRNMRDLAEKLNGSFEVNTDQESGGAYVRVRIPLAQVVVADE